MLRFLGFYLSIVVGLCIGFFLLSEFGCETLALQIATLILYTLAVSFFLFCPTRLGRGYSPRNKGVQAVLPRLLCIHAVFLVGVFLGQTVAFRLKPHLPASWTAEYGLKHDSVYSISLIVLVTLTIMSQVAISRNILSRSVLAEDQHGN